MIHDDGLYRHLRCRQPGTSMWGWDVVTWPGHLAVTGDLGAFTFAREQDMLLQFFHGLDSKRTIDTRYWLEKCVAWDKHTDRRVVCAEYLQQRYRNELESFAQQHGDDDLPADRALAWRDALALADELNETSEVSRMIQHLMENIDSDAWDWSITKPDYRALNVCLMIAWTHDRYREHLAGQVGGPA